MSYGEPRSASGALGTVAWAFIALGSASLLFLAVTQTIMIRTSRQYGIDTYVLGSLLFFFAFGLLESAAIWATLKRYFGVSIAFGGFVGLILGFISLFVLAGVGL